MERAANFERFDAGASAGGAGASRTGASVFPFALVSLGVLVAAVALAGWTPLRFSIVTVFLFAGPHNWFEFRYFLARMPVRWGRSRNFFLVAFSGIVLLAASYAALPLLARAGGWSGDGWLAAVGFWNSLLIIWIAALVHVRGRLTSRRDWSFALPVAFALVGLNWLAPEWLSLALVYLHPLVALWFLDRHLRRTRPDWRRAYHVCLSLLPVLLALLWWQLADAPPLADGDALGFRITQHAGAGILTGVSSHLLVATHVFLETAHYGVWLLAMPLVGMRVAPWRFDSVPLVRHRHGWPRLIRTALVAGAVLLVLLWFCFLADYPTTRDVYFTVAMLHVLAEVPFLLRML